MKFFRALLLSAVTIGGSTLLLLSATAFIVAKAGALPRGPLPILTTTIGCGAVFLGGFLAALAIREKGLFLGLGAALLLALCMGLISFFFYQQMEYGVGSVGKISALLFSGAIGGILGANRKNKVKF